MDGIITPRAKFGYIPGLDGLRAIAVMIVIIAHLGFSNIIPGGFGVTVFFFISGFLITRLLLAERDKNGQIGLKDFYIRRFLRLLPALYFMLLVTCAIIVLMGDHIKIWELLSALFYIMNYHNIVLAFNDIARSGPWEHLWSLAVEEHFYLIFPLLLILCRSKLKHVVYICLAICGGALLWRLTAHYGLGFPSEYTYSATETRLDSIVYGCLLSLLLHLKPDAKAWRHIVGWLPIIGAVTVLLTCFLVRDEGFRQTWRYSLQGLAIFVGITNLYFFAPVRGLIKILEARIMRWTGRVSYGLYVWHIPVIIGVDRYLGQEVGSLGFIGLALILTFLITSFSFYYIERPVIGLRKRFGSHIQEGGERSGKALKNSKQPAHRGAI